LVRRDLLRAGPLEALLKKTGCASPGGPGAKQPHHPAAAGQKKRKKVSGGQVMHTSQTWVEAKRHQVTVPRCHILVTIGGNLAKAVSAGGCQYVEATFAGLWFPGRISQTKAGKRRGAAQHFVN